MSTTMEATPVAPEKKTRTKVVRVKDARIKYLLARYPCKPFPALSEELIGYLDPELQEPRGDASLHEQH